MARLMTRYFTNASGPGRDGQLPGSIGVLEALDKPMPIGIAAATAAARGSIRRPAWMAASSSPATWPGVRAETRG